MSHRQPTRITRFDWIVVKFAKPISFDINSLFQIKAAFKNLRKNLNGSIFGFSQVKGKLGRDTRLLYTWLIINFAFNIKYEKWSSFLFFSLSAILTSSDMAHESTPSVGWQMINFGLLHEKQLIFSLKNNILTGDFNPYAVARDPWVNLNLSNFLMNILQPTLIFFCSIINMSYLTKVLYCNKVLGNVWKFIYQEWHIRILISGACFRLK